MDYSVILKYSTTDKCYIVSVPDLPGCMADGKTPNEAYENAKLVIKDWILYVQQDEKFHLPPLVRTIFKGQIIYFCPFPALIHFPT